MSKQGVILIAAFSLACSSVALAQDAYRAYERGGPERQWDTESQRPQERCAERYARRAARLAYLEARLSLTDQQKPAFAKWRQARLDAAEKRRAACLQHQPGQDQQLTALDREARREKILSEKLQTMQATRPALQALYDSLSAEQKA